MNKLTNEQKIIKDLILSNNDFAVVSSIMINYQCCPHHFGLQNFIGGTKCLNKKCFNCWNEALVKYHQNN